MYIFNAIYIDKIALILFFIMIGLAVILLTVMINRKYEYHFHEYGHVIKLKENIYKDIYNYKKEIKSDEINIQVVKFLGSFKVKTYCDYFKYLENKKQLTEYQEVIKDIAIGGYVFSKHVTKHINFHKLYILFSVTMATSIWLLLILYINHSLISHFVLTIILYILCILSYIFLCNSGYGPKNLDNDTKAKSDHYTYCYPEKFKYTDLEEDKKHIQKEYKILLNVKIDLNNRECPTTAVEKDMLYKLIIKKFPLDDKTS
mgnify:FL=1